MGHKKSVHILVADDDVEDCKILENAFRSARLVNDIHFVHDGEQLLNYLNNRADYADENRYPTPSLILLDWKMPKKSGIEALAEIKGDARLKKIPVIFLTTSNTEEDIIRAYNSGVNSYIQKPVAFESMVATLRDLEHYWFEIVSLPEHPAGELNEN